MNPYYITLALLCGCAGSPMKHKPVPIVWDAPAPQHNYCAEQRDGKLFVYECPKQ